MRPTLRARVILKAIATGAIVPVLVVALWHGLSVSGWVDRALLPSPGQVLLRWWAYLTPTEPYDPAVSGWIAWALSGELLSDALASLYRVLAGFLLGTALALPLGILMGTSERIYRLANPTLQILRPIPPIAYIHIAIQCFGLGNPPSVIQITICAFFPVMMNTIAGVRNVEGIYLRAARNLGAGPFTLFWRVVLPAATPYILTGARVGIGTAFIVVIVAEMIAVNNGLGFRILEAREYFWSDKIIAGMATIGLLGLAIDGVMSRLNARLLRWHRGLER